MRLAYLNLLPALISLLAAVYAARRGGTGPPPVPRLLRRLSRMLMYFA